MSKWVVQAVIVPRSGIAHLCWWPADGNLDKRLWTQRWLSAKRFPTESEADELAILIRLSCGPAVTEIRVLKLGS